MMLANDRQRTGSSTVSDFNDSADRPQIKLLDTTSLASVRPPLQHVGIDVDGSEARALERSIALQIMKHTNGQIRSLVVNCRRTEVMISGRSPSYYQKQLALQGVLDALRGRNGLKIDFRIEVNYA